MTTDRSAAGVGHAGNDRPSPRDWVRRLEEYERPVSLRRTWTGSPPKVLHLLSQQPGKTGSGVALLALGAPRGGGGVDAARRDRPAGRRAAAGHPPADGGRHLPVALRPVAGPVRRSRHERHHAVPIHPVFRFHPGHARRVPAGVRRRAGGRHPGFPSGPDSVQPPLAADRPGAGSLPRNAPLRLQPRHRAAPAAQCRPPRPVGRAGLRGRGPGLRPARGQPGQDRAGLRDPGGARPRRGGRLS